MDVKSAVEELLGDNGHETVGIRSGEKIHETLINSDEMRYTWELGNKYLIFNPLKEIAEIEKEYPGIKRVNNLESYSSNKADLIPIIELNEKISKLISH